MIFESLILLSRIILGMTDFSLTPLQGSVANLLAELETHIHPQDKPNQDRIDLSRLDQLARVIQSQLKTLEALEARAGRERAQAARTYTRFEDLPPPPPEERARMVKALHAHFAAKPRESGDDAA